MEDHLLPHEPAQHLKSLKKDLLLHVASIRDSSGALSVVASQEGPSCHLSVRPFSLEAMIIVELLLF